MESLKIKKYTQNFIDAVNNNKYTQAIDEYTHIKEFGFTLKIFADEQNENFHFKNPIVPKKLNIDPKSYVNSILNTKKLDENKKPSSVFNKNIIIKPNLNVETATTPIEESEIVENNNNTIDPSDTLSEINNIDPKYGLLGGPLTQIFPILAPNLLNEEYA